MPSRRARARPMRVPIPLMAGLQIAMGAPPAPRMIGEVDDPFQTMEVCSGGEDGTSSEEEADWKFAPGLMDDSSGDEVDSDEEEDSGPGPGCTADGGCCRGNAPPRQQFMLPRLWTTGTLSGTRRRCQWSGRSRQPRQRWQR